MSNKQRVILFVTLVNASLRRLVNRSLQYCLAPLAGASDTPYANHSGLYCEAGQIQDSTFSNNRSCWLVLPFLRASLYVQLDFGFNHQASYKRDFAHYSSKRSWRVYRVSTDSPEACPVRFG